MVLNVHIKQAQGLKCIKRNLKFEILQILSSRLWYQVEGVCTFNLSGAGPVFMPPLISV